MRCNMINDLIVRYPALEECRDDIEKAKDAIIDCYENGGKLLLCGNGGSAADCDHIVGELMKGFMLSRALSNEKKAEMKKNCPMVDDALLSKLQGALPAVSLPSVTALNSAFCNDVDAELVYAQPLMSLAKENDILIAISTSGNSKNVFAAAKVAKALGIKVIALTGKGGGKLASAADVLIAAPETETYKVQELHLPIYHCLCAMVEKYFFE
ncbi:MAG: SIS domain-containing protein [Clostridia bacterium]|nr:SIS domain-containing protein [Clostridia bacterium]